MAKSAYKMSISRMTIDKLGIKMYDKASAVLAELVANSYDADAENVSVSLPMGRQLDLGENGKKFEIKVTDDGIGMGPDVINNFYLSVGTDRRQKRGDKTEGKKRNVMGRKGIGKLAPFGICKEIEVETAGGKKTLKGYKVANFILKYDEINQDKHDDYIPDKGNRDGSFSEKSFTTITLREFYKRKTPDVVTFGRQIGRRFSLGSKDFCVTIIDPYNPTCFRLTELNVEHDTDVTIDLSNRPIEFGNKKLPVHGWVAYARKPYKNEDMAGIRIYARGKIVSTTRDFGIGAGFEGEYSVRSYLVGEIHAEWLDTKEDYIRSDRQDILWDADMTSSFQEWGMQLIRELGKKAFKPMREKTWKLFMEQSNIEKEIKEKFNDTKLQDSSMKLAKIIGQIANRGDLNDADYVDNLKNMIYVVTPHKMLVDELQKIDNLDDNDAPLTYILKIFADARIAEIASLGQVASERIQILEKLTQLIRGDRTIKELELEKLLETSPWLINSRWTLLSANRSFSNMRKAFEAWYKKQHGEPISTTSLSKNENKRPDFILLSITTHTIEIVEIKTPNHALNDKELESIIKYHDGVEEFLDSHNEFKKEFPDIHITLICDDIHLGSPLKLAYEKLKDTGVLTQKSWERILKDSIAEHDAFLSIHNKN